MNQAATGNAGGSGAAVAAPALASRLTRDTAIYALVNFGTRGLNFALLALYTRFLTPGDYGTISLAETVGAVVVVLCSLGVERSLQRMYFQYVDDAARLRRYIGTIFRFAVGLSAAVVVLVLALGPALLRPWMPELSAIFYPYVALAAGTAACYQFTQYLMAVYLSQGKAKGYAAVVLFFFVATTAAVTVLVVALRGGAWGMLLGKLVGAGAAALGVVWLARQWWLTAWDWAGLRATFVLALPLVPYHLTELALYGSDRLILAHYRSFMEVGLYSLAYSIGMMMHMATASLERAWVSVFYELARREEARETLVRLSSRLLILLVAVAVFGSLVAQDVVGLVLDSRFHEVGRLVPWIIAGYLLYGFFIFFQLSVMQGKRTGFLALVSVTALAANLALNFLLVPRYGMYGAAAATVAAFALEAALMYRYAQKVFPLAYQPLRILAALAVFAAALGLSQFPWSAAVRPLAMLAGMGACFALLSALAGENLMNVARFFWRQKSSLWTEAEERASLP